MVPPTACTGQGAVIDLSRTSLPPREPVALENRFTAAEERERSNERHRGSLTELDAVRRRTEILLSLRRSPPPRGPASRRAGSEPPCKRANERRRDQDGDEPRSKESPRPPPRTNNCDTIKRARGTTIKGIRCRLCLAVEYLRVFLCKLIYSDHNHSVLYAGSKKNRFFSFNFLFFISFSFRVFYIP